MCGIAGILDFRDPVDRRRLKEMTDALRHRGPDGEGWWFSEDVSVGLGCRRLSIIDLSEQGSQPMVSADGRYCIVYNGAVYNYLELRDAHIRRGIQYRGHSDTEVVLNHVGLFGEGALSDLDGMFAFAVWDNAKKELFCARDRFGEKPFYYFYDRGRRFVFASEIKALFAAGLQRRINHRMLYAYFRNPANAQVFDSPDATYYENICKLPSATFLRVADGAIRTRTRYWSLNPSPEISDISFADAEDEFKLLFFQSVSRRLRSDVSVGSSLSGGIDSSAIVCAIRLLKPGCHYKTFSARFEDFEADEGEYIDEVNATTGAVPNFVYPSASDLARELGEMFCFQDEPVESSSAFAQWCVMRLVEDRGVVVLLDGQGGDEIAAGYHEYFAAYLAELRYHDPAAATEESTAILSRSHPDAQSSESVALRQAQGTLLRGSLQFRRNARKLLARTVVGRNLPGTTFLSRSYMWEYEYDDRLLLRSPPKTLNEALQNDLIDGKLEHYLRYADRNSMGHSREVRLPFLSHELVEFMFSLPPSYKIRSGWTKYLLRAALKDIVPDRVLWRKDKVGFATPQTTWMGDVGLRSLAKSAHDYLVHEGVVNKRWTNTGTRNWEMIMAHLLLRGGDCSSLLGGVQHGLRGGRL